MQEEVNNYAISVLMGNDFFHVSQDVKGTPEGKGKSQQLLKEWEKVFSIAMQQSKRASFQGWGLGVRVRVPLTLQWEARPQQEGQGCSTCQ